MALALNLTLLVQMIHFIGAYLFISRYFLRPGYEAAKEDDERIHQIRTNIIHQQKNIADRSLHAYKQWQSCQEQFMLNRPVLEKDLPVMALSRHREQFIEPSGDEIQAAVHEISAVLKERVLHV